MESFFIWPSVAAHEGLFEVWSLHQLGCCKKSLVFVDGTNATAATSQLFAAFRAGFAQGFATPAHAVAAAPVMVNCASDHVRLSPKTAAVPSLSCHGIHVFVVLNVQECAFWQNLLTADWFLKTMISLCQMRACLARALDQSSCRLAVNSTFDRIAWPAGQHCQLAAKALHKLLQLGCCCQRCQLLQQRFELPAGSALNCSAWLQRSNQATQKRNSASRHTM